MFVIPRQINNRMLRLVCTYTIFKPLTQKPFLNIRVQVRAGANLTAYMKLYHIKGSVRGWEHREVNLKKRKQADETELKQFARKKKERKNEEKERKEERKKIESSLFFFFFFFVCFFSKTRRKFSFHF